MFLALKMTSAYDAFTDYTVLCQKQNRSINNQEGRLIPQEIADIHMIALHQREMCVHVCLWP